MLDHAITVADRHRCIYEAPFSPSKRRKIAPLIVRDDAVHGRSTPQLAAVIEMMLNHEHLSIQDSDVVRLTGTCRGCRTRSASQDRTPESAELAFA